MPRYFFHSANEAQSPDNEGTDLPDFEAAQVEAIAYAGETLRYEPDKLRRSGEWHIDVTDAEGRPLFTLMTKLVEASAEQL